MIVVRIAWWKNGGNIVAVVLGVSREAMRGQRGCDVGASCKNYHGGIGKVSIKNVHVISTYKKNHRFLNAFQQQQQQKTTKTYFLCHRNSTSIYILITEILRPFLMFSYNSISVRSINIFFSHLK